MKILQADGSIYVFGKSVYNKTKVEATFDVSGRSQTEEQKLEGLISYNGSLGGNGKPYSDKFENKITTPGYAHTFLISSVLSSDYEDVDSDGPSDQDLGSYTKFEYTKGTDYKWRVPHELNTASFNEGFKSSDKDQKGNYLYGVKELTYLNMIETKTHVAFIDLEDRTDAMSVISEAGGMGGTAMQRIKSIRLFSKPELLANNISLSEAADVNNVISVLPIKTAHFVYNYSLCKGIPSSSVLGQGKLTLERLYFTYRGSNMGKFTPYVFKYAENDSELNQDYKMKGFDIWGNYKAIPSSPTLLNNSDFPFVQQDNLIANKNTAMWVLKSVELPSGGTIKITTESDDYKYVQNKKAMQMFKVIGAGTNSVPPSSMSNKLFDNGFHNKYIYVQTDDISLNSVQLFKDRYLFENINKPIYFKFLLKMEGSKRDFVSGYFEIDKAVPINIVNGVAALPLKFIRREGGTGANVKVNPIAKSGWGFGRTNLNRLVYGGDEVTDDFVSVVKGLVNSIQSMTEIYKGPNKVLETKKCAESFDASQSWIRLENPNGKKLGGGLRVKKIELSDNWDVMNSETDNPIYEEMYGQDYSYTLEDGISSSGVATFEPNSSPENPFVEPFYGTTDLNYEERINAPRENNYVEKPFGENFFPSPKVTYSRVTVSNLNKNDQNGTKVVKKHATGKVVTEHYTSKDFPTLVDYTDYDVRLYDHKSPLLQMLSVYSQSHLTASQGFTIETNDMDGKVKSQKVYAEGQSAPISRVDYKYNVDSKGKLDNEFTTINENGLIQKSLLGINYDVINDFNESRSVTQSNGFDANLACFLTPAPIPIPIFVPLVLPREAYNETQLRTATTTKVLHRTAVLVETTAYDLGSRVSTKNLAWDAKSGQVLVTQTTNEFDDKFYSLNYPAYWYYKNMGMASENIDLTGTLVETVNAGSNFYLSGYSPTVPANDINKFFKLGDELMFEDGYILWVYNISNNHIRLMDEIGTIVNSSTLPSSLNFKVVRSGNRNQQMASMASITLMANPIDIDSNGVVDGVVNYNSFITSFTYGLSGYTSEIKIVNASAIEYSDDWLSQCENRLPSEQGFFEAIPGTPVNPYLYNIKGDWRAVKSYAYLTGRNNFVTANRRKAGYFVKYNPFYKLSGTSWSKDDNNWTFASEVTMYSPYGVELENKDALDRYSSAQYGYNYTLPVAVSSNSTYKEMGFDGFEDYDAINVYNSQTSTLKPHFGFSQSVYIDANNDGSFNATITNQKSHTGNYSVKIMPGKSVQFKRKVDGCPPDPVQARKGKTVSTTTNTAKK